MLRLSIFLIFTFQVILNQFSFANEDFGSSSYSKKVLEIGTPHWQSNTILEPTKKAPARTAILIIAPPEYNNSSVSHRWELGKKVWEQYMHSHPDVDCYFLHCGNPRKNSTEQVWLEGNTIIVGDEWYEDFGQDRILRKTVKALEWLGKKYTHFIRTNINTFVNLKAANEYMETHHQSMYTTPLWQSEWYTVGYAITFSADVAAHIVNEYNRLEATNEELISCYHADDAALTALATGVWPYDKSHPFNCCPSLPFRVRQLMCEQSLTTKRLSRYGVFLLPIASLEEAIYYCEQASDDVILYRTREGLSLEDLAKFYGYLFNKIYPELDSIDLLEYLKWIRSRQ